MTTPSGADLPRTTKRRKSKGDPVTFSGPLSLIPARRVMLKMQQRRLAHRNEEAVRRLAEIELSIVTLSDDDLLDLADIFQAEPRGTLRDTAWTEVGNRNINL